jgi:putative transcriptional regulator
MTITAKIRKSDRKLVRVHADGHEEILPKRPIRPMTDAEVEAAAAADPDAQPLTAEQLETIRRAPGPRVRTLRRALGLTQEEFASRFRIPLGTLRDWEQGRTAPDQPARAYLKVIARDPGGVCRALQWRPEPSAR